MRKPKRSTTIGDFYKIYKERHQSSTVTKALFNAVCEDFNKAVTARLMKGEVFVLPFNLGKLRIRKRKIVRFKIDFGTLRKEGIKTFHFNDHTKGYFYQYFWEKKSFNTFKNKGDYVFKPSRLNSRTLAKLAKESKLDFLE